MRTICFAIVVFYFYSAQLLADSNSISQIEMPYVLLGEKEITLASLHQKSQNSLNNGLISQYKLSTGKAFSNKWFGEIKIIGKQGDNQTFTISSYELEAKRQLTEQGEYSADYGLYLKYEDKQDIDIQETEVMLIATRQWGKILGTANLSLIYEAGSAINDEFEASTALQVKYRYKRELEPAIEFYSGQITSGVGPVLMGSKRLAPGKRLNWESGIIFGLNNNTANQTYRFLLEYEF